MENQAGFVEDYICIQRRLAAKQAKESEARFAEGGQAERRTGRIILDTVLHLPVKGCHGVAVFCLIFFLAWQLAAFCVGRLPHVKARPTAG